MCVFKCLRIPEIAFSGIGKVDQQSNNWNLKWCLTSPRNKSLLSILKKRKKKKKGQIAMEYK